MVQVAVELVAGVGFGPADVALGVPGVPDGSVDDGAAPSPTSGSSTGRSASGGGAPAGRTIASSCALVSFNS